MHACMHGKPDVSIELKPLNSQLEASERPPALVVSLTELNTHRFQAAGQINKYGFICEQRQLAAAHVVLLLPPGAGT
jgi:hypothetical protein